MSKHRSRDRNPELFEIHEPPPDGVSMLLARLHSDEKRPRRIAIVATTAIGLVSAVGIYLLVATVPLQTPPPANERASAILSDHANRPHPALISYGLADALTEPVTLVPGGTQSAAMRVQLDDSDVVFYWVSSVHSASPGAQVPRPFAPRLDE